METRIKKVFKTGVCAWIVCALFLTSLVIHKTENVTASDNFSNWLPGYFFQIWATEKITISEWHWGRDISSLPFKLKRFDSIRIKEFDSFKMRRMQKAFKV